MSRGYPTHHSPFGSSLSNRAWSDVSRVYRYGFNGKEKDSETANDAYDFGARVYDGRLGRWLSVDLFYKIYPAFTTYCALGNNPLICIDPDGKRIYFVPGLGYNEQAKNNSPYVSGVPIAFKPYLDAHKTYCKTIQASKNGRGADGLYVIWHGQKPRIDISNDKRAMMMINSIVADLSANPLKPGEQMNIVATSQGTVSAAQAAISMLEDPTKYGLEVGFTIDNLVLAGSPIDNDSKLYQKLEDLKKQGKIKNIQYDEFQAEGDVVTGLAGKSKFGAIIRGFGYVGKIFQALFQTIIGKEFTDPHIRAAEDMKVTKESEKQFSEELKEKLKNNEIH
jgi:RHS repeat-associated protein